MEEKQEILYKFDQHKKNIRAFGVKRIGFFGSFARGQARKQSDLDVLVEFETGGKTFDHFMDLKFFLQKVFGKKIDLVLKESLKPAIRQRILKEVIYA